MNLNIKNIINNEKITSTKIENTQNTIKAEIIYKKNINIILKYLSLIQYIFIINKNKIKKNSTKKSI